MIIGNMYVTDTAVETHKDSYKLSNLTVVSTRRQFLPLGLMVGFGSAAFAWQFYDLLFVHERLLLVGMALASLLVGFHLSHLQLLSRDLRGSEIAGVIWGTHGHLNKMRRSMMAAMQNAAADKET